MPRVRTPTHVHYQRLSSLFFLKTRSPDHTGSLFMHPSHSPLLTQGTEVKIRQPESRQGEPSSGVLIWDRKISKMQTSSLLSILQNVRYPKCVEDWEVKGQFSACQGPGLLSPRVLVTEPQSTHGPSPACAALFSCENSLAATI